MSNLKKQCNAILKDPFFKGRTCNKNARHMVKLEGDYDYINPRCGTHSRKEDKIDLYPKKEENIIDNEIDHEKKMEEGVINNFNFGDLLKYIESEKWKKEIPKEIQNLFDEIDNLNNNIEKIILIKT